MATNEYIFIDRWRVKGTIEEIYDIIADGPDLARWWGSVYEEVKEVEAGDAEGLGKVSALRAKGWLPYHISFSFRITELNKPHGFSLEAWGDLTGLGIWKFEQDGEYANISYEWRIRADKPILRTFSFILKPIFRSNHIWTMKRGEESLKIELQRRHARTAEELARVPAPPQPAKLFNPRFNVLLGLTAISAIALILSISRLLSGAKKA